MHHQSLRQYRTTLWTLICIFVVNHLISTKLHCAPPKCASVQNHIVNLDLHVCRQPPKYYTMRLCPYVPAVSPLCSMVHDAGWWCTTQVNGAQHSLNKPGQTDGQTLPNVLSPCYAVDKNGLKHSEVKSVRWIATRLLLIFICFYMYQCLENPHLYKP